MLVVERSPRHSPTHLRNLAMNRRMWHRDDACILVVSGKAFVEEIDSASSSVLFPRYRSRWRGTFPDALITSPTLFLDVEACIPSAASSLGPSFARLLVTRPCAAQAWSDYTRSVGADNAEQARRTKAATTEWYPSALQVQRCPRSHAHGYCAGDDNALETDGSRGAQLGSPPADWAMTMPWSAPLC